MYLSLQFGGLFQPEHFSIFPRKRSDLLQMLLHRFLMPLRIWGFRIVFRGCLLRSHREYVGIAGRLEERKTAGKDEVGEQERIIVARHLGGIEEESAECVQTKSNEDASLIAEAADEDGGGERHCKVASVERHLHKSAVSG